MAVRQRHASDRGLYLEHGARPHDRRKCGRLVAHADEARDGEPTLPPGDLPWSTVEPVSPDADFDRPDADHRHGLGWLLSGGIHGFLRRPGHSGDQNVCSVVTPDYTEQAFDVKT
jgi:hypothetical protein